MAINLEVSAIQDKRCEHRHDVADRHQHVIQPRKNPQPDHPFPDDVVTIEVEVKRFIIRAVPQVMTDVTLSKKMKWSWEEQCHDCASNLVGRAIRKEHRMLGLMND